MIYENEIVIGTAGHVDHGKSSIIKALTGTDPDNLKEEKIRGLSIQPGFGWTILPSGKKISIVDLPGHERFIKNMIIGAVGIDLVLLVISAEEGVMPQTLEHCSVLKSFGIEEAIIIISKEDLVEKDWLDYIKEEIKETLKKNNYFTNSPIITVSIKHPSSIENIKVIIDKKIKTLSLKKQIDSPIIPIDRVFQVKGFGTVVAGKLSNKKIQNGEQLELLPQKLSVRVRNIEVHGNQVEIANPGNRVAINLVNNESINILKGNLLAYPEKIQPSFAFDAYLKCEINFKRSIKHNHKVTVFIKTDETEGIIRILGNKTIEPGEYGWVQIKTNRKITPIFGDKFLVRDSENNLGSGIILIPHGKRYKKNEIKTIIKKLKMLHSENYYELLKDQMEMIAFSTIEELSISNSLNYEIIEEQIKKLCSDEKIIPISFNKKVNFISKNKLKILQKQINEIINFYHIKFPSRNGIPLEECRKSTNLNFECFQILIRDMELKSLLKISDAIISLPKHKSHLNSNQMNEAKKFVKILKEYNYTPPTNIKISKEILIYLTNENIITKITDDIYYEKKLADDLIEKILDLGKINNEITISSVRNKFGTSRKYTLAILEYMDGQNLTKRIGDIRYIR